MRQRKTWRCDLGVGPIFLLPTAIQEELGTEKWGAGPSAIALTMKGP